MNLFHKSQPKTFDNTPYWYSDGTKLETIPGYHPHKSTRYRNYNQTTLDGLKDTVKSRELPEQYKNRENCCGCTACYAICPASAITMDDDEEGFKYPVVDIAKCIRCHKCLSVCAFKEAQREKGYFD